MPIIPDNNGAGGGGTGPQGPPGADGDPGPGFSNYTDTFTDETTLSVTEATHQRTGTLKVEIRRSDGVLLLAPYEIDSPTQDVTVYFAQPTSGTIIITGEAP